MPCGEGAQHRMIICPYHAWTYSLSGELRAAGTFKKVPGFEFGQWGLRQLPVTEWHGLVFVDASGGAAASLEEALAKLDEIIAPYEPGRLVTAAVHGYDAAANWKILTENYHECYHCPSIHPELCRVSPPKSGENYAADGAWVGGWMDLRDGMDTMSLDGASGGVPLRGLDQQGLRTVIYVNILPNVLFSLHPDYVMTHRLTPVGPDRTRIECSWAFAPEAVARPEFDPGYAVEFWDITNRQDWAACESVQRGLASPHASPGPLAPDEDAVYSFVTTIARGYLGQPLWSAAG
jgi:Rieske 2Fe-2S family protein